MVKTSAMEELIDFDCKPGSSITHDIPLFCYVPFSYFCLLKEKKRDSQNAAKKNARITFFRSKLYSHIPFVVNPINAECAKLIRHTLKIL